MQFIYLKKKFMQRNYAKKLNREHAHILRVFSKVSYRTVKQYGAGNSRRHKRVLCRSQQDDERHNAGRLLQTHCRKAALNGRTRR